MIRFVLGFVFAILVLVVAGLAVVFTGGYNVAASVPHSPIETWVLSRTMTNSVQRQARGIAAPPSITEEQVRRGFVQYRDSCVYCHGAPGVDATNWAQGITPEPPYLADTVRGWHPAELFWIVRNGVKMTAMPAFGKHLSDQDIWGVVGFIQRLPGMSAAEYTRLAQEADQAGQAPGANEKPAGAPSR